MFKTKLQELCQKQKWSLPKYSTTKQGLDHNPSFSATVIVNDQSFHTMGFSKSSKEAQNDAARLAFEHFTLPPPNPNPNPNPRPPVPNSSSFPQPSLLSFPGSGAISEIDGIHPTVQTLQQQIHETHQTASAGDNTSSCNLQDSGSTSIVQGGNKPKDVLHLCKSELQTYAQKRNLVFPVYSCEREGPPHASRFRCRVTVDGKTYESPEYFPTLKEAEHAAANVALIALSPDCIHKDDSAFYKNLLQELVQKEGLHLPTYYTNRSGEAHSPVFVSSVEIEGEHFTGQEAKSKKQAEMSVAKVAYNALKERRSSQTPIILPPSRQEQLASELQSNTSSNLHQHITPAAPILQARDNKGRSSQTPIILPPSRQEQLASELQSNTSSNLHQHITPNAPILQAKDNKGRSSQTPIILPPSRQEQLASELQSNTSSNLHQLITPNAPILQAKDNKGEGGSSLSEPLYRSTPDAFPSALQEPGSDSSLPSSNCSSNLDADLSIEPSITSTSLSYKKITVYPANKLIPDGSTLLPMRDDNWVAFVPPEATN